MPNVALISGISGQTGSYLAEHLLGLGYEVHGIIRRSSAPDYYRIAPILKNVTLWSADLHDQGSLVDVISNVRPSEVYNLAAQSFVPTSWSQPLLTADATALGVTRILESIKCVDKKIKFYQASSSEMFGKVAEEPQKETTPFYPRSPYGVAKLYGHWITINYRESFDMFTCSGILFNHESPRRGIEFLTKKVSDGVARIKLGMQKTLRLGNLDAIRDWGFAGDYAKAMHLMLQQDKPDDYVIATGQKHSVRDFVETAFKHVGLNYEDHIVIDQSLLRPAEVVTLCGDASKAHAVLGWKPEVDFYGLVAMMVDSDIRWLSKN